VAKAKQSLAVALAVLDQTRPVVDTSIVDIILSDETVGYQLIATIDTIIVHPKRKKLTERGKRQSEHSKKETQLLKTRELVTRKLVKSAESVERNDVSKPGTAYRAPLMFQSLRRGDHDRSVIIALAIVVKATVGPIDLPEIQEAVVVRLHHHEKARCNKRPMD
jgi:hypothetical protein